MEILASNGPLTMSSLRRDLDQQDIPIDSSSKSLLFVINTNGSGLHMALSAMRYGCLSDEAVLSRMTVYNPTILAKFWT
jgi:hypothetical protein